VPLLIPVDVVDAKTFLTNIRCAAHAAGQTAQRCGSVVLSSSSSSSRLLHAGSRPLQQQELQQKHKPCPKSSLSTSSQQE
jgi:hypothetical protein